MGLKGNARSLLMLAGAFLVACGQPPSDGERLAQSAVHVAALSADATDAYWPLLVDPLLVHVETKLTASNGAANDWLGLSVALSGDTALVGASQHDAQRGSAYVYTRSGATWSEQQQLSSSEGEPYDWFGSSVALFGDTALVGAPADKISGVGQGSAYVYVRSGTSWTLQQQLIASDGESGDHFGVAVALAEDTALVGASRSSSSRGSAYIYLRNGTSWTEQAKLTAASDSVIGDEFGLSVALSDDTALVGAPASAITSNLGTGAAYVYERGPADWSQKAKLTANDGSLGDAFGCAVALSGDTALVGAYQDQIGSQTGQGSAYVYERQDETWNELQQLAAAESESSPSDYFGYSVALWGDTALVGARWDTIGTNARQGSAFVYVRSADGFAERAHLVAPDGAAQDNFGVAVALSGKTALVGASAADVGANVSQGAAYPFRLSGFDGDRCDSDAECASTHCSDGVCCDLACTGPCDACSVAAGADTQGACKILLPGSLGSPACEPQTCNGTLGSCSACTQDAECPTGTYCSSEGGCKAQKKLGDACQLAAGADCLVAGCRACASASCADGVCCDAACVGPCEACSAALTGAKQGACSPIPEGDDPENECEPHPDYPESCQSDGTCDGERQCRQFATEGTPCGDTCSDHGLLRGRCTANGTCRKDQVPCDPYACDAGACRTSCADDSGCADDAYCGSSGSCSSKNDQAEACQRDGECRSSFCADGVCCDKSCDGQCEACNDEGHCDVVEGQPRGEREPCNGTGVCGGSCDGSEPSRCTYPGSAIVCDSRCEGASEVVSVCDGVGACQENVPDSCGLYACVGTACRTECSTSADCADGHHCEGIGCRPNTGGASCSTDLRQSRPAGGEPIDCDEYLCDETTGACRVVCDSTSQCSPGYICNPSANRCDRPAAPSQDSGCTCRTAPAPRGFAWPWLLAANSAMLLKRRRHRPRTRDASQLEILRPGRR